MADQIKDHSTAGTAKDNIPTQSQPMDNIHGNVEVIRFPSPPPPLSPFPLPLNSLNQLTYNVVGHLQQSLRLQSHHLQPQHQRGGEEERRGDAGEVGRGAGVYEE